MGFLGSLSTPGRASKKPNEDFENKTLTGREGNPIFLEDYNDDFLDACEISLDQKQCHYCEDELATTAKSGRCHGINCSELHHHHHDHHHHDHRHNDHDHNDYDHHDHDHNDHHHNHQHHNHDDHKHHKRFDHHGDDHDHHYHHHHDHHHRNGLNHSDSNCTLQSDSYLPKSMFRAVRLYENKCYMCDRLENKHHNALHHYKYQHNEHDGSSRLVRPMGCGLFGPKTKTQSDHVTLVLGSAIWYNEFVSKCQLTKVKLKQSFKRFDLHPYPSDDTFKHEMITIVSENITCASCYQLRHHNIRRARHGVDPLKFSLKLSEKAQEYADMLAKQGALQHSDKIVGKHTKHHHDHPCGENLALSGGREGVADMSGKAVTDVWYSTKSHYNFDEQEDTEKKAGNFTQIVWRASKLIGIGRSKVNARTLGYCIKNMTTKKQEKIFVVALYYPRGNVIGYYCQNVYNNG